MKKIHPAVKSMVSIAFYLVLIIGIWTVIARLVFPDKGETDQWLAYIQAHEPLLVQVAQNAMDEGTWTGIRETEEVRSVFAEGGIEQVENGDGSVYFIMRTENAGETLRYVYLPNGDYAPPDWVLNGDWVEQSVSGDTTRRWIGGTAGKGSVSARRLTERFYIEDLYNPE